jgi:rhodanese-related sulfurtransferase
MIIYEQILIITLSECILRIMRTAPEAELINVDVATMQKWLRDDEAVLVDVREPEEYREERIPGALPLPLSQFDASALPCALGKRAVLVCFIGGRSARAAELLFEAGHSRAFHLDGGLFAWKEAGLRTVC